MPRHVIADSGAVVLRDYAPVKPPPTIPPAALQKVLLATPDASEMQRTRFGRSISADMIEVVLRRAAQGNMRDLTDLVRESIFYDPHYAGVLRKRIGTVAALPWEVRPAEGPDVDKAAARDFAALVRSQLMNMTNFRDFLQDLAWALVDGRAASELEWIATQPMTVGAHTATMAIANILYIHPRRLSFGPTRYLVVTDESAQQSSGRFAATGYSLDPTELKRTRMFRKYVQWMPRQFGDYQEMEGIGPRGLIWSFFKRFAQRDRMQLLELFGKPWRVGTVEEGSDASPEDFAAAKAALDGLGSTYSAMLPRGIDVDLLKPGDTAGNVHKDVIAECDRQISKLVLGQTGTTDNMAGGLNTSQAGVMQDEQFGITTSDALAMSQVIESQVTDAIIEVNFGVDQLPNAPVFVLRSDLPPSRSTELERLEKALKNGLAIEEDEAYAVSGFRRPEEGATVIKIDQPPSAPLAMVPPAPRPVAVYPAGKSPSVGEQQPIAETASVDEGGRESPDVKIGVEATASIVTVNEARAAQGLPPLTLPDGQPDPNGFLTIAAFTAATTAAATAAAVPVGAEPEDEEPEDGEPVEPAFAAVRSFPDLEDEAIVLAMARVEMERADAAAPAREALRIALAEPVHRHESAFGSTEDLVQRGDRELNAAARTWANAFAAAVRGQTTAVGIYNALVRAAERLDVNAYARPLERRMRQGAALGSLDNALEVGQIDSSGKERESWQASRSPDLAGLGRIVLASSFADMPFREAMTWFKARDVLPRATWEKMTADVRRRSFTVAGVQSREMLAEIQGELARQVGKGADLREFTKFMEDRLVSAGMVAAPGASALGAAHVENIFRTNMANAYHAGRYTHATQPAVMRVRPIWQWRCLMLPPTPTGGGSRETHKAAHNKMLYASDPFWQTCYPPAGFQCILPEQLIGGRVFGGARSFYRGKALKLTTAHGRCLTVTANHPILTPQGFAAAQTLVKGRKLVCYISESGVGMLGGSAERNEYHAPAPVQQVFSTLAQTGMSSLARPGRDDFHGEARLFDGEIDVVGTYRSLVDDLNLAQLEQFCQILFESADPASKATMMRLCHPYLPLEGNGTSPGGGPSSFALALDGGTVHLHSGPLDELRLGAASHLDTMLGQNATDGLPADAALASNLLDGFSGEVVLDELVDVCEFDFAGHVYDLHSPLGWIIASGIVTSNCGCRVITRDGSFASQVGSAADFAGLPDPGFTSGVAALL